MLGNLRLALIVFVVAIFGSGCTSNQPDASNALKDAEKVAKNDLPNEKAFSVADLSRENGWAEGEDYKIHFTYNLITKVEYPQLVVELLDQNAQLIKAMSETDRNALTMQVGLGSMMSGLSSEVPDLKKVFESYKRSPVILNYIQTSKDFQNNSNLLASATYLTEVDLNSYQVVNGAPTGTKISRQVAFTYRKTEKGWQKIN